MSDLSVFLSEDWVHFLRSIAPEQFKSIDLPGLDFIILRGEDFRRLVKEAKAQASTPLPTPILSPGDCN